MGRSTALADPPSASLCANDVANRVIADCQGQAPSAYRKSVIVELNKENFSFKMVIALTNTLFVRRFRHSAARTFSPPSK